MIINAFVGDLFLHMADAWTTVFLISVTIFVLSLSVIFIKLFFGKEKIKTKQQKV